MAEPFKITATADGKQKEWTRNNWGSIIRLKHAIESDVEAGRNVYADIQLWVLGFDNVWRTIDEDCQCGCQ